MTFSPDYVRLVMRDNFEDAKARLLLPLLAIHEAHLVMLVETGIVSHDDGRVLRAALEQLDPIALRHASYDGSCEDLFFHVEGLIGRLCPPDIGGRLHTARSRNDIDMTMYRMQLREDVLALLDAVIALRRSLLDLAEQHVETIFPAHTHGQPAQPTTVAHYMLAVVEELERDTVRLFAAYATTNRCPLGACAITGTGFPIDRTRTSDLLGFAGPTGNTYGSIASADYLLESCGAAVVTLVGLGRMVQDMLLWSTKEMGYLRLPDGFVQVSSIMPQKRNPVALEHARALASKALGQAMAIPQALHNTPFGDIVDTEDDLQPLVASAFRDATRATALTAAAMAVAELDRDRMRARASSDWVTLTELADTLARDGGLPFVIAHKVASGVVRASEARPDGRLEDWVRASAAEVGVDVRLPTASLAAILSPDRFIAIRRTHGGPAPDVVRAALARARDAEQRDRHDASASMQGLLEAAATRHMALQAL